MLVTGIDIIEISRIKKVAEHHGERFLKRLYTESEVIYCKGRAPQLASRFAAKEAVMKALGTGTKGVSWKDIEVVRQPGGPPQIQLHGTALEHAARLGIEQWAISLSHSREFAIASVVGEIHEPVKPAYEYDQNS